MQNSRAPRFFTQQPNTFPDSSSWKLPNDQLVKAPTLKHSASQPITNTQLFVADGRPTYASVLKTQLANTMRTKGSQTSNDTNFMSAEEIEWFGPPTTTSRPPPVFPVNNYPVHYPQLLSTQERLNFALYPPTRFSGKVWEKMWEEGTLVLDLYVATTEPTLSDICRSPSDIYFRPETEFTGFEYRVKIDEDRCHKPLVVKAGNVIDILKTNTQYSRYIIDLCQMIRDGRAYFPVHYREYYGQGFTNASDPRHPSFILDIPESFCQSLVALHLRANSDYYASIQSPSIPVIPNRMISMKF